MLRRKIALILALLLAVTSLPAALASGSYSAHTPLSSADDDKLTNLRLAAQAIDGLTVPAGDSFSFNQTVGPREKRRGYREAPNGRGVVVTGGGVAQAASTLYMALLQMDDVDIDPVKTYGNRFSDDYVQDPSLAIVTDYDAGIDLSFTNLGDDLSIDMWLGDDDLWCVVTVGREGGMGALRDKNTGSGLFFLEEEEDEDDEVQTLTDSDVPSARSGSRIEVDDEDEEEDDEDEDEDDEGDRLVRPSGHSSRDDDTSVEALGSACIDCGGDKDVLHNVTLAAECVNDTMLDSGDDFSFNDIVGPRTNKYGYRRAVNGRGAKVTGGGVAQVATVLWLAIKDCDDIDILEKSTYGKRYNQHYVSHAADAILTDYASGRDFRFRYTGDTSLTIYAYVEDGWLYCDVYEDR